MTMSRVRTLLAGRGLVESPRWHGDRLYFSDWSAGEVLAVDLEGRSEVVARVKSLPLCTAWLPDGRLIIVSSQEGLLLRLEPDGSLVTHADLGRPGWNDIVADGRGNIYVNGPALQPDGRRGVPAGRCVPRRTGRHGPPGGRRHRVPERHDGDRRQRDASGRRLLPASACRLRHRRRRQPGRTPRLGRSGEAAPDGICADAENAVWYAEVPGRRCVRVAEGGAELRTVPLDRGGFACVLGGPDGRTLFITAAEWRGMTGAQPVTPGSGQVLAVAVDVPGAGWP